MKLLLTGASGFIGRNVLEALPADWDVVATWHGDESFPAFARVARPGRTEALRIDLADAAAVEALAARHGAFDACIYLAANGDPARSVEDPLGDLRANARSVLAVTSACRFGRFVFFSSGAVYDGLRGPVDPSSALSPKLPYAISKWAAERYVLHACDRGRIERAAIVRFFGAYGPHEPSRKIYGRLVRRFAFERGPRFAIRGDGRNLIDAMYVEDTVRAVLATLERLPRTLVFDLASGAPLTLTQLVERTARRFGIEPAIEYVGEVPEYIEFRTVDRTAQEALGFRPAVTLEDGLERFRAWMRAGDGARPADDRSPVKQAAHGS